ncbi:MAG TPA: efflux RND transporter periplasmic adaptor subunit [Polyangia bacterium]
MKRTLGWIATLMVVAACIVGVLRWRRAHDKPESSLVSVPAAKGRLVAKVTATGTLSALVTVQVGAQVSGRISKIMVDFNSPVKKGEVVAKIDPQLFSAAVEQAKANATAAEGNLAKARAQAVDAERQYQRNQQLRAEKLIAQADLDTSQANAEAAKAQVTANAGAVEQAKASLHQAVINLDYTTIVSPINGTVISRNVDVGQTVASALQAPTLFTIAEDLKKMQVDTNVAEADVGKLKAGMIASFSVDAYPTDRFKGVVRQIRNAPQSVQNVVTYDAVIDVDNSGLKLKPGMTANITFVYAEKDDVLRVPNAALRFNPPPSLLGKKPGGGMHKRKRAEAPNQRTVWIDRGGQPVAVPIEIGVTDGSFTEVQSGALKEGDPVITEAKSPGDGSPRGGGFRHGL